MLSTSQDIYPTFKKARVSLQLHRFYKLRSRMFCSSAMQVFLMEFLSIRIRMEIFARKLKFRLLV